MHTLIFKLLISLQFLPNSRNVLTKHQISFMLCGCRNSIFPMILVVFLTNVYLVFFIGCQHGADVHGCDHTGQTALHWAAVRGSIQVAELLLQNGAQVECADSHGYRVGKSD
jgi:hypothetical protein